MNKLELKFLALNENIYFARNALAAFVSYLNPSLEEISDLKTIVSEGVSNAIIHGYRLNGEKYVYLKVKVIKRKIEIVIQDYGVGIENVKEVVANKNIVLKEGEHVGMGFAIMQTLADSFECQSYLKLGTRLIISKNLSAVREEVY